jgi:hypothetical protein
MASYLMLHGLAHEFHRSFVVFPGGHSSRLKLKNKDGG